MRAMHSIPAIALTALLGAAPLKALELSTNGLGQVLVFPYYTVNSDLDTLITVANPNDYGVAARVRVLEGNRGRPVADIDLFLAPSDVWTAAITRASDGAGAILYSTDRSCTRPEIPDSGFALSGAGYDGSGALPADDGPQGTERTREGSIEVFAGARIESGSATDNAIRPQDGAPPDCASLPISPLDDFPAAADGIYGSASIINVGEGTLYGYTPEAISHFTEVPLYSADNGPLEPSLAQANSSESTAGGAVAYVTPRYSSGPGVAGPVRFDYAQGIDAVTALFMSDAIYNEYLVSPGLGAATDWVVTFPTRRFYLDPVYGFSDGFTAPGLAFYGSFGPFAARVADREGGIAYPVVGPLAYDVNVVTFTSDAASGSASGVFGSHLTTNVPPQGNEGIARLRFTRDSGLESPNLIDIDNNLLLGEPVTGFMAYKVLNDHAQPGLLANYGSTYRHRATACSQVAVIQVFNCLQPPAGP